MCVSLCGIRAWKRNDAMDSAYTQAIERIETIHARDHDAVNPLACSQLWTHQRKTERAILLWHGYTSSPYLYRQLAPKFFELGYNVWTPRLPHAGLANRLTNAHARLTRDEIKTFAGETIEAARGLADQLTVAGESLGGVMAAWAAQNRGDVDRAVMINTSFAMPRVPAKWNTLIARIVLRLPNVFIWWDLRQRNQLKPLHAYPRFATHALMQIFLLAAEVESAAQKRTPAAKSILSITTAKDPAVNNRVIAQIVEAWRKNGGNVAEYQFDGIHVPVLHDIIDPEQPNQNIDYFYPILIDWITHP